MGHADWLFELKYDGFRALAYIVSGRCRLVSRNFNTFTSFQRLADEIAKAFPRVRAVLDGELACLDRAGRPAFKDLLFRRREPIFVAFDLLYLGARDVRGRGLLQRKTKLRELLHGRSAPVLYADHIDGSGGALFQRICDARSGRGRCKAQARDIHERARTEHLVQDSESRV